jgi:hypothetical protein
MPAANHGSRWLAQPPERGEDVRPCVQASALLPEDGKPSPKTAAHALPLEVRRALWTRIWDRLLAPSVEQQASSDTPGTVVNPDSAISGNEEDS